MKALSKRAKRFCVVIMVQTGCIAIGLWMEHQYVKASVRRAAEEKAWTDIETSTEDLHSTLGALTIESLALGTLEMHQVREKLSTNHPPGTGAMIVDREWRIVVQAGGAHHGLTPAVEPGYRIAPTRLTTLSDENTFTMRFSLDLPDGPHIAAACMLHGAAGYVVVHRAKADVDATSSALVRPLTALSGITLLWMSALLGLVVYLILTRFHDEVDSERKQAAADTLRRTQNLVRTRDAVIFGLAQLADSRDPETGEHLERISIYATGLATALQRHPKFSDEITPTFVRIIGISSALHDIGKVGIEDRILRKPDQLTPEERILMQAHARIGGECLQGIEQRLGSSNFLQMAREIAFAHHERWDGSGYPDGLAEKDVPLSARIVAIVDVYDALSSKRVYKPPLPHEECVAIIQSQAGKHFDPELVDVWLTLESKFREIANQYTEVSTDATEPSLWDKSDQEKQEHRQETLVSAVLAGQR